MVGAAHSREARADALDLGHARVDGVRAAVCDRGADRPPDPAGRRIRRRRRLLDVDGRIRDLCEVQTSDQSGDREKQHARDDQMGADGVSRES